MEFDPISKQVLQAALKVHSELGPGLFEEVYKVCLRHELNKAGLKVLPEVGLPVTYDGVELEVGYRIDLLVEDVLIVELKSVERLAAIHKAQLLTYLKLARKEVGLLLNFNTDHLRQGIVRVVNSLPPSRPSRPSR
jgi:GxxExxY protein